MIQVQVFGRQRQRQRQRWPDYNNTSTFFFSKKKKVELKNEIVPNDQCMNNVTASYDKGVYIDALDKSISVDWISKAISMLNRYKSFDYELYVADFFIEYWL
jgi:hypothetical protein